MNNTVLYSQFGAKGDGKANDFAAIKATHVLANQYGHIVTAKADSTYKLGSTGGDSIPIMTDTNWNGCTFIFDDASIAVHSSSTSPYGGDT